MGSQFKLGEVDPSFKEFLASYQLLYGKKPKIPSRFRIFREMGIVTTKDNIVKVDL